MKNFYVITNALNTVHSVLDTNLRQQQIIYTIASIRQQDRASTICFIEMSAIPMTDEQRHMIQSITDYLFEYSWDPEVNDIYHNKTIHIVKNLTETLCLNSFFYHLKSAGLADNHQRIFKVSGRYTLTDSFNVHQYAQPEFKNKIVFAKSWPTAHYITDQTLEGQYMSRLWSFDAQLLEQVSDAYMGIYQYMVEHNNDTSYIDVEHTLYKLMPKDLIIELNKVGIQGIGGFTGTRFED